MKIIDKTDGLRPYTGGMYLFIVIDHSGKEESYTSLHKMDYKKHVTNEVKTIKIDLL